MKPEAKPGDDCLKQTRSDSASRFSNRVEDYIRYRPSYPKQAIDDIIHESGLKSNATIAEIGSGTGILTRPFLERGFQVIGIEPNPEMRAAAERLLKEFTRFRSRPTAAEDTGCAAGEVDLIVAGQAFHWFDRRACRAEWRRILSPQGAISLLWNERLTQETPFLEAYEQLLHERGTDYASVNHANITDAELDDFFGTTSLWRRRYPNEQTFDRSGFLGRVFSSSYVPGVGQSGHEALVVELERLFDRYQTNGRVTFLYQTKVYIAHGAATLP